MQMQHQTLKYYCIAIMHMYDVPLHHFPPHICIRSKLNFPTKFLGTISIDAIFYGTQPWELSTYDFNVFSNSTISLTVTKIFTLRLIPRRPYDVKLLHPDQIGKSRKLTISFEI